MTATKRSDPDRQRRRLLGRQPRRTLPARPRRQARRPDARVPRRADAGDPQPSCGRRTRRPATSPTSPTCVERLAPLLRDQPALKIVTNAGGPESAVLRGPVRRDPRRGRAWETLPIGIVTGDDVLPRIARMALGRASRSTTWRRASRSRPWPIGSRARTSTSAPGRSPRRSRPGAGCVMTGRVADASLTLGPAAAHHGWSWDDWDRLAGASVAGHLIECGAQVTGGLWHEWDQLPDLAGIGYPIAEVAARRLVRDHQARGHRRTGERRGRSTEQLLYEIDDPARYRTPDVDVDFTTAASGRSRGRIASRSGGRPAGRRRIGSRWRSSTATAGRPAGCSPSSAGTPRGRPAPPARSSSSESAARDSSWPIRWSSASGAGDVVPGVVADRRRPVGSDPPRHGARPAARRPSSGSAASWPRWSRPGRPGSPATPPAGRRPGRRSATGRPSCPRRSSSPASRSDSASDWCRARIEP